MVRFKSVCKSYHLKQGKKVVFDEVSVTFGPNSRIGILGLNGAGKTTMLRLIAGSEEPDSGQILRRGRISFPVGFTGTFEPHHSARENVRFLSHIYDMDVEEMTDWIEDFVELGKYFDMPVSTYSSGMFAKLAFGTSFAFDFDTYLVDEAIEVGDARFRKKCAAAFSQRLQTASLVLVSHHIQTIRQYCDQGAILYGGKLTLYASIDDAVDAYEHILRMSNVG